MVKLNIKNTSKSPTLMIVDSLLVFFLISTVQQSVILQVTCASCTNSHNNIFDEILESNEDRISYWFAYQSQRFGVQSSNFSSLILLK